MKIRSLNRWFFRPRVSPPWVVQFWGLLLGVGLAASGLPGPAAAAEAATLDAYPPSVELTGRDARQQLLVTLDTEGRAVDATRRATYVSRNPAIAALGPDGVVLPVGSGETTIEISVEGGTTSVPVRVTQGESWLPVHFDEEINPILTKRGCNGGGCHGKATGQGGFLLSLFGFEPAFDHEQITAGSRGRRLVPSAPERSLLLLKPTMQEPHGGGARLTVGEPEYERLVRWIAADAPRAPRDRSLDRVELMPPLRALRRAEQQQLVATAVYSDGARVDVTRLVDFRTNDPSIADVDQAGLVTTQDRVGETALVAVYCGHVAVSRIQVPLETPTQPVVELPIRNFVDRHVQEKLRELRIAPSAVCDDATFLRRATLQIAGRIPTREEVVEFLADSATDKRDRAVDRLLASPDYADYFSLKASDILRNKRRGNSDRLPGTIGFNRWIRDALATNMPYDRFVREIITATGDASVNPPAQWYAEVRYLESFVDDTAQVFLGMRIGCARCHHHPFEKISQEDYYGLAAFFGRLGRKGGSGVAERRANEAMFVKPAGEVRHPTTGKVVPPHGLGGSALEIPPYADPRHALVDWMTEPSNPYFARAFVNRMWAHFMGRGLVEPLDDLRVTNPATNDPLLDELAAEFVRSGFDMRHVIRVICTSTTWQLAADAHEDNLEEVQNHSRFYPQRLAAEVLLDSIDQATGRRTNHGGLPAETRAVQLPDEGYSNAFLQLFGRPLRDTACECERSAEPSLSQSLYVMNDQFVLSKVFDANSLAGKLAVDTRPPADRVGDLFLAVLSRPPRADEVTRATEYLAGEADAARAWGNLLWALLNTKEFQFVH